jgi:hypothetical protein
MIIYDLILNAGDVTAAIHCTGSGLSTEYLTQAGHDLAIHL